MGSPFIEDNEIREVDESSAFGGYYASICETMKKNNVPKNRIPSFAHFLSKAFGYLDEEKMEKWISNYIENEKVDI